MTWTLGAVGDVMLGDHPVCFGHGVRSTIDKTGLKSLLAPLASQFETLDYLIGNLESPLSAGIDIGNLRSAEMLGRTSFASDLFDLGFDGFSIANNHALHHGIGIFNETVDALQKAKLAAFGLADDKGCRSVAKCMPDGASVAFLAYSLRPEQHCPDAVAYARPEFRTILSDVQVNARKHSAVVVSLHWGDEYIEYPSLSQREMARNLVESGATVVIGHHPHVLQGIEQIGSGLVAYSLGNFCFDTWIPSCRRTALLKIFISGSTVSAWHASPLLIGSNFFPKEASPDELAKHNWVKRANSALLDNREIDADAYSRRAAAEESRYRVSSYRYFFKNLYRYPPRILKDSLLRAAHRRLRE